MKDYELSVVFHPDLEVNLDPALGKVKKIIESASGKIINEENDGKKRLAYSIDGQDFGIYYYFDIQLPAEAPAKISSTFNITDEILRYLLVKADPKRTKANSLQKEEESTESADSSTNNQEKGE